MRPHLKTSPIIGALLALALLVAPPGAQAGCNLIPVARNEFPSVLGGIASPITAPGKTVELRLRSCENPLGFEPNPLDNTVTIDFEPPTGVNTNDIAIDPGTISVADCSLPGGRCSILLFEMPDTTAELAPTGLAGPARIYVRDLGATIVAEIGELFLPTSECDKNAEPIFQQLTILPPANLMADVVSGAASEILATVDGGGNLLIPFDHWGDGINSVLADTPGSPIAIFLEGMATVPADSGNGPTTVADAIIAQPDPSTFLRSFAPDGRPLPPLLRITETGDVFGTSDTEESVIRAARSDDAGGPILFDLTGELFSDRGPIRITTFDADTRESLPLVSLRTSGDSVAFVNDLNEVQIVDAETGAPTNTGIVAIDVIESSLTTPALQTEGDLIAFLDSGNGLSVFTRDGTDITAPVDPQTFPEIDTSARINHRAFALSGGRVFVRTTAEPIPPVALGEAIAMSTDEAHVYVADANGLHAYERDPGTGALSLIETEAFVTNGAPVHLLITADGAHVYYRTRNVVRSYTRDAVTGELTFLEEFEQGVNGVDGIGGADGGMAFAPGDAHLYVVGGPADADQQDIDALALFSRDPGTGLLTFVEAQFEGVNGVSGLARGDNVTVSPNGAHVYVGSLRINFDEGAVARFNRNGASGALTFAAIDVTTVNAQYVEISPDGSHVYQGLTIYDRDAVTGALAASGEFMVDGGGAEPSLLTLYAEGTRAIAMGFGNPFTSLIYSRNLESGALRPIHGDPTGPGAGPVAATSDGRHVYVASLSTFALAFDQRVQVFDTTAPEFRAAGPLAGTVAVNAERALILTPELLANADLNGDGDMLDDVAQLVDASGASDVVVSLEIAADRIALGSELFAVTIPETYEGDLDQNSDGDSADTILAFGDPSQGPPLTRLGVAASQLAVSGTRIVFARPEAMEPPTALHCQPTAPPGGCDLNGDGDALDDVLHLVDTQSQGPEIINVGQQVGRSFNGFLAADIPRLNDFVIAGNLVVFFTEETEQGGVDLNGDLVVNDTVTQILDVGDPNNVIATSVAAAGCLVTGCQAGEFLRVDHVRQTVSFLSWEPLHAQDLDGDGSAADLVLVVFNVVSGEQQIITLNDGDNPGAVETFGYPELFLDGTVLFTTIVESEAGVDLNGDGVITDDIVVVLAGDSDGDGVLDDFDTCVESPNPDELDVDGDGLGDTSCDPDSAICPALPLMDCLTTIQSGKSKVQFKDRDGNEKDQFKFSWKGEAATKADFGNPVTGIPHYSVCTYDTSGNPQPVAQAAIVPGRDCSTRPGKPKPCWKELKSGFKYKDKAGFPDAIQKVLFKGATIDGKTKVNVQGKGAVQIPPLPLTPPVQVQVIVNDGGAQQCFEATYSIPQKNVAEQFKAKSD